MEDEEFLAKLLGPRRAEDDILEEILFFSDGSDEELDEINQILNADGSIRQNKRLDYSRSAKRNKSENPWETTKYLRLYRHRNINDPTSVEGKEFRAKFRLPYPVFVYAVSECRKTEDKLFNYPEKHPISHEWNIPLELKIMCVLRILGCGLGFDAAADMCGFMSATSARDFFTSFVKKFRAMFEWRYIGPLEGERLERSMKIYALLGLVGCCGSMDATNLIWIQVPKMHSNAAAGDKGKGLLINVVCDHNKEVIFVQPSVFATNNDKISVKYNDFILLLKEKKIYKDVVYRVRTGLGENDYIELSQVWVVVDGGYLEETIMICGFPASSVPMEYKFTDWVASVRKDVECFFGILKARWRWFRNPITVHFQTTIDDAFITACIFHNMILRHDGLDRRWEDEVNWNNIDPGDNDEQVDASNDDDPLFVPTVHTAPTPFVPTYVHDIIPPTHPAHYHDENGRFHFQYFRDLLAKHLSFTYRLGKLRWPKIRSKTIDVRGEINDDHNQLPRDAFPNAGDLEF